MHIDRILTLAVLGLMLQVMAGPQLAAQSADHHMHMASAQAAAKPADIVRDPADVPPPIGNREPGVVRVTLTAQELLGELDASSGTTYRYWTFNGKVPGPMIRVRQGDTVEVTVQNDPASHMTHSVDFHAAIGPGGGAALSQTAPGQSKTFSFKATTPGLFVYHCGTPMIAEHIANGMYGMILVEPPGGLPKVDREYYLMQGEIYTAAPKGKAGLQQFGAVKLMQEAPADYYVFNGAVDAVSKQHPMQANAGDTVRIFFGDAGPNGTSSIHMVGQIFTKAYELGSLTAPPLTGVQTDSVPPGGAAMLELKASVAGKFPIMDHAMSRMAKGLMAVLNVTGAQSAELMHEGPVPSDANAESAAKIFSGMTEADTHPIAKATANGSGIPDLADAGSSVPDLASAGVEAAADSMPGMDMNAQAAPAGSERHHAAAPSSASNSTAGAAQELNGCLTLEASGRAMLKVLNSSQTYRLEAQPLLFSENANRLVHVTGYRGSVVADEDPKVPSFVVDSVDKLATNCSARLSGADIRRALAKPVAAGPKGMVGMTDMGFQPATITVEVGEKVTWKNTAQVFHNVVDDASKAISPMDVSLPSGSRPFDSGLLPPGQTFSRVFTVPGVYHYVCTLHESNGMKGTVIVKPASVLRAQSSTALSSQAR